jgi:UDP-glucose 4-epimerase
VELLAKAGYEVVVVDNLYAGSPSNIDFIFRTGNIIFLHTDITNYRNLLESLRQIVSPGDVEGIIHLAAIVNIVEALNKPRRTIRVNVVGTANMLEIARKIDAERFVFASSVAVYGEPRTLPLKEDHPLKPVNLYGLTKLVGEELLWRWYKDYGIKGIALRYFNVYGPRMRPGPYAGVIYRFIKALIKGVKPVIYGDGKQTRDFVYVRDVARANLLALRSSYIGPLNICTGKETTILELYTMLCSMLARCPSPEYEPPRPGDVRRSVGDPSLARQVLGWEPSTDLKEGLAFTLNYYLRRDRLY